MAARAAMNAAGGPKISLLALLARICVHALARFPELNSTVDTAAREIVRLPDVHLGFAAQTPRGLVVPVVKDAGRRTAESLTEEFGRLTEAARQSALTPADLTGGTFTLNNYGVFGVDGSTPIINHPEAAMLGVGRIIPKPWVHQGELAVRQVVQLSLTFDHRSATAARRAASCGTWRTASNSRRCCSARSDHARRRAVHGTRRHAVAAPPPPGPSLPAGRPGARGPRRPILLG